MQTVGEGGDSEPIIGVSKNWFGLKKKSMYVDEEKLNATSIHWQPWR